MNFWTPEPEWGGQDAFLIGGGPSLSKFDFFQLEGLNTIGCNDAFRLGPSIVQICLFGDAAWWQRNKWELEKFTGRIVTNSPALLNFEVPRLLKMKRERDGIHDGASLGWNFSTGAMAINLAISLGAIRIFLLGYDLRCQGTRHHWHNYNQNPIKDFTYQRFVKGFETVRRGLPDSVEVYNVTDGTSQLKSFEDISFQAFQSVFLRKEIEA